MRILFFLLLLICINVHATDHITLNLREASLPETIYLFAKVLNKNIVISPNVQGTVSLFFRNAPTQDAFRLLLMTHGLAEWRRDNIFFVAPRAELMKHQSEELKWQELQSAASPLITHIWPIHYGKAEEIAHLLQDEHNGFLSKRGSVRVDVRTNSICVQDIAEKITLIRRLIYRLDIPIQQVLIEARLASVDNDFERELGIAFDNKHEKHKDGETNEKGRYSLAVIKLTDGISLDVKLAALENEGHAELISSPSLFTANQQPASIEAGEEVPYQEVSESGGTAVSFKKAVLGLKVTPQVLPNHNVLLHLQISQDRPSSKMVLGVPTISTRQIVTNVMVSNGQTIVLGGIYETNQENAEQRVPLLSALPIVGELFKIHLRRNNKRELLIFVTPKIIV